MSKINDILKMMSGYVPPTTQEEYTQEATTPQNFIGNAINPLLDKYVNPHVPESLGRVNIPTYSVGELKDANRDYLKPENIGMAMLPGNLSKVSNPYLNTVKENIKGLSKEEAANFIEHIQEGLKNTPDPEFGKLDNLRQYLRKQANAEKVYEVPSKDTSANLRGLQTRQQSQLQDHLGMMEKTSTPSIAREMAQNKKNYQDLLETLKKKQSNPEDATAIIKPK